MAEEKLKQKYQNTLATEKNKQEAKNKSIKSGGGKPKKKQVHQQQVKTFLPFTRTESVLLVGEGDFSFACSLIKQDYVRPENLVATSYDSAEEAIAKYPTCSDNIDFLRESGVRVVHDIDATKLVASFKLETRSKNARLFDTPKKLNHIMFNFPHTGRGMKDVDRNIRDHQKLVLGYFKSAKELLGLVNNQAKNDFGGYFDAEKGDQQHIILSMFEGEPYISWSVKSLARSENLRVERSGAFDWLAFEGYHHKRTNSTQDTTKPAAERAARIYVFDKALTKEQMEEAQKKKKVVDSDDE